MRIALVIETALGDIEAVLEPGRAPANISNFMRYVDGGFYTGGRVHRTVKPDNQPNNGVKIEVIQAGVAPARETDKFAPIALERTNATGLQHVDGAISMARSTPDSALADFFICIGAQPELDYGGRHNPDGQGFAAFGQVTAGMDVVRRIRQSPCEEQRLTPPIEIRRVV